MNIPIAPLMFNAWKKVGLTIVSFALIVFACNSALLFSVNNIKVYAAMGIICGLLFLAMSQEKNETEYVIKLRYNAYRITFNTLFLSLFMFSGWDLLHHEILHSTYIAALIGLFTYLFTFYIPLITNGFGVYSKTQDIENVKKEPLIYIWIFTVLIGIIVFLCLA